MSNQTWEAKKLALCVLNWNWKQMKLSVSVCARFCVSVRCDKACFGPSSFWARWWLGNPVSEAEHSRRRNPTSCQEPTAVPGHLAIREYHQQLLLLILIIVSQQAWQHHGGEKTMVGPATPGKILAFTISMNFYIATISGARSFAIWRSLTCQIKSETRMIKQMPSLPWTVFSVPFTLSFQGCTYPDLMPKALTEPERRQSGWNFTF